MCMCALNKIFSERFMDLFYTLAFLNGVHLCMCICGIYAYAVVCACLVSNRTESYYRMCKMYLCRYYMVTSGGATKFYEPRQVYWWMDFSNFQTRASSLQISREHPNLMQITSFKLSVTFCLSNYYAPASIACHLLLPN